MITCVTYENLHLTGKAFDSQFMLRHKCFIDRQSYNVKTFNGKEYDQYDTPATVYLVYCDVNGNALGVSRLIPTSHACMLNDLWPDMVQNSSEYKSPDIWEGTRFCVDKRVDPNFRKRIVHELVLAYLEFGIAAGITKIIGIMPGVVMRSVFKNAGINYEPLGIKLIDGIKIQAAAMSISEQQLEVARKITGIKSQILSFCSHNVDLVKVA
jgi:acyl homoserine lactone synthase